ncbi:unnamed protein product, partial [Prorocentrum cordatum]
DVCQPDWWLEKVPRLNSSQQKQLISFSRKWRRLRQTPCVGRLVESALAVVEDEAICAELGNSTEFLRAVGSAKELDDYGAVFRSFLLGRHVTLDEASRGRLLSLARRLEHFQLWNNKTQEGTQCLKELMDCMERDTAVGCHAVAEVLHDEGVVKLCNALAPLMEDAMAKWVFSVLFVLLVLGCSGTLCMAASCRVICCR